MASNTENSAVTAKSGKWPGWPGYSVFRLVVPQQKVGRIIGKKGDAIRNIVQQTRTRIRVLNGPPTCPDRIVLISGKEDPGSALPPAINAMIRIFKVINGMPENDDTEGEAAVCLTRLLVAHSQAISLIGKEGSIISCIRQSTGASVRVVSVADEISVYAISDEREVVLKGEAVKVLKALEAVARHLRKFLVDQSVLPYFDKDYTQERQADFWTGYNPIPVERESPTFTRQIYDTSIGFMQTVQTIAMPLAYAYKVIGVGGANIEYIWRRTGATVSFWLGDAAFDEMILEIRGTSSQVQEARGLIEAFGGEPLPGSYGNPGSSHTQPGSGSSSSFGGGSYGGGYAW